MEDGIALGTVADAFVAQFEGAHPRVIALGLTTFMEDSLLSLLKQHFKSEQTKLFGEHGVLSGLNERITFAHAVGLVNELAHHDLILIREIRNCAAHCVLPFEFENPAVKDCCKLLHAKKNFDFLQAEHPLHKASLAMSQFALVTTHYAMEMGRVSALMAAGSPVDLPISPTSGPSPNTPSATS